MQSVQQLTDLKDQVEQLPIGKDLSPAHTHTLLSTIADFLATILDTLIEHRKALAAETKTTAKPIGFPPDPNTEP